MSADVHNHHRCRRHRRRSRRTDGGGNAGAGRRSRHRFRRDAVGGAQIPDGGARRAQSHPQRAHRCVSGAVSRGCATACRWHRSLSAGSAAGVVRNTGTADLRWHERADISESPEGFTIVARLATAARRLRRAFLLRHRWIGWDDRGRLLFRDAGRAAHHRRTTPRCWRWAARAGRGWARTAVGSKRFAARRWHQPAQVGQLRVCGRLVRYLPRPL